MFIKPNNHELIESILFLFLIAIAGYLFSFGLDGIFLVDDYNNIGKAMLSSFNTKELLQVISSNTSGILGRPISVLSFSLTGLAHGGEVWGFKYHNILLHLIVGISVFCLSKRLLNLFQEKNNQNGLIALFVTAVWLLHPLQVSTVMYAVQRMTQLSALFSFLAILIFLRALDSHSNKVKTTHYFFLFPITLLASIFSKENGVLTLVLIGVITTAISFSSSSKCLKIKREITTNRFDQLFLITFIVLPLFIGLIGFTIKFDSLTDYSARTFTLEQRLLSQIDFVFLYINQLLLPKLSSMGLFFDDTPIPTSMSLIRAGKLFILSSLLLIGIYNIVRGKAILGIGILFYFSGHLLESTVIPLELAFEHRNYLPSFGVFLAVTFSASKLYQAFKPTAFMMSSWFVMLLILLLLRLNYWSNEQEWHRTILAYHPKSERTQLEYIFTLYKNQEATKVIEHIDKARRLIPNRVSMPIKRLTHSCQIFDETQNEDVIITIQNMLLSQPLTTIGFNSLGELVNIVLYSKCSSVSKVQVYAFVGMAMERQAKSNPLSSRYGYLHALKAKMEITRGEYELAHSLYMKGFELTGHVDFIFWAITALLVNEDTRSKGYKVLDETENDKYFYSAPYRHRIDKLKEQLLENNFKFIF